MDKLNDELKIIVKRGVQFEFWEEAIPHSSYDESC